MITRGEPSSKVDVECRPLIGNFSKSRRRVEPSPGRVTAAFTEPRELVTAAERPRDRYLTGATLSWGRPIVVPGQGTDRVSRPEWRLRSATPSPPGLLQYVYTTNGLTMMNQLRDFVDTHPDGWDHQSWLNLLASLKDAGVDVSNTEEIGLALERTRLAATLKGKKVQGLGPKRIQAVVDRFGTLWNLRHASAEEIAEIPTIHADLAGKVRDALN